MKKQFLFSLMMMAILLLNAQGIVTINGNDKFIEIKISDTLQVNAELMTLMIKATEEKKDYNYFDDYDEVENEKQKRDEQNKLKNNKTKIEALFSKYKITNYKYHDKESGKNSFTKDFSLYEGAYEVKLENTTLFKNIETELKAIEGVSLAVTQLSVKDKHEYELKLIERLMEKAKKEAQIIAKQMGVGLGNPINVSNQSWDNMYSSMFNNTESMGGFGALFGMLGNMFNAASKTNYVTISKTLVVRYAIAN